MSNSTDQMASELPEVQEGALAHPAGESGEESASANPIGQQEIDGLDQSNIISDGSERSAKPSDFKGDDKLDAQVEEVSKADLSAQEIPVKVNTSHDPEFVHVHKPVVSSKVSRHQAEAGDASFVAIDDDDTQDDDEEYQPPGGAKGQSDAAVEVAKEMPMSETVPKVGEEATEGHGSIVDVDPSNILHDRFKPNRPHDFVAADQKLDAAVDEVVQNDSGM